MKSNTEGIAGTYSATDMGENLILEIRLDDLGSIDGRLSGLSGEGFALTGRMQGGIGVGVCANEDGGKYFEAGIEEDGLLHFSLIEPDARSMPDYSNARRIIFTRREAGAHLNVPADKDEQDAEDMFVVMQHLSGRWQSTTGVKRTTAIFRHDGTYTYQQEGSYAGPSAAYYSDPDMMCDSSEEDSGEWEIRGDRERGVIIVMSGRGGRGKVEYQVRREDGQPQWNKYWLNRELFVKQ